MALTRSPRFESDNALVGTPAALLALYAPLDKSFAAHETSNPEAVLDRRCVRAWVPLGRSYAVAMQPRRGGGGLIQPRLTSQVSAGCASSA